jgi:sirohydrochlorin cobaltochelatase
MKTFIILAMHGTPPNDFPRHETAELFDIHARTDHSTGPERETLARRHAELEAKMRAWPRTGENDPFHAASLRLGEELSQVSGREVIVGFNEFCGPSVGGAIDQAIAGGAEKVVVLTPMMTQGGEHSERDIPAAIGRAQERHPEVPIVYAWPFEPQEVAKFLASQIERFC